MINSDVSSVGFVTSLSTGLFLLRVFFFLRERCDYWLLIIAMSTNSSRNIISVDRLAIVGANYKILNCAEAYVACLCWLDTHFSVLVVRGYIKTLFPVGDGQSEQANVIATEVIRQENYIFVKSSETDNKYTASIKVPGGCHWKETEDRLYLLTGNLESGRGPVLQCHIKETAWLKVLKEDILHLCSVVQFK